MTLQMFQFSPIISIRVLLFLVLIVNHSFLILSSLFPLQQKNPTPGVAQTRISIHRNADEDAHQQPRNLVASSFYVPLSMSASAKMAP